MGELLDAVSASESATQSEALEAISGRYLEGQESTECFDWRYYMVRYPSMRGEGSRTYFAEKFDGAKQAMMGYSLCMLRAGTEALNSYYRDPYLLAIRNALDDSPLVDEPQFSGYEYLPRWLRLTRSGARISCVPRGFELFAPGQASDLGVFVRVCQELGISIDNVVAVQQVTVDGQQIDSEDRIQRGAQIVDRLIEAGL